MLDILLGLVAASDDSRYVTLKVRRTITITMEILDGEVTP